MGCDPGHPRGAGELERHVLRRSESTAGRFTRARPLFRASRVGGSAPSDARFAAPSSVAIVSDSEEREIHRVGGNRPSGVARGQQQRTGTALKGNSRRHSLATSRLPHSVRRSIIGACLRSSRLRADCPAVCRLATPAPPAPEDVRTAISATADGHLQRYELRALETFILTVPHGPERDYMQRHARFPVRSL